MKKVFIFTMLFLSAMFFAQKKSVSYTVSGGAGYATVAAKQKMIGSGTLEIKPGFHVGLSTAFLMPNSDEIELGVYYQQNKLEVTSAPMPNNQTVTSRNLNLIFIPLNYKYNFENTFFIKGGPIFSIDSFKEDGYFDNFSGIGFGVSAGKDFGEGNVRFRLAPFANAHTLLSFNDNNNFITDFGLQLGLVF